MSRIVFITGASSGFGEACAHYFARSGYALVLAARREDRLQALAKTLSNITEVYIMALDVRCREKVEQAVRRIPDPFQSVDVLVNNAGLALGVEPANVSSLDDWDQMIDTNIKGLTYLTHAILPGMVERNAGQIINIGSTAGRWPYPGGNTYCASKAFVEQFTRCLRADLLGKNIKVNCLAPGMSETEFSLVRMKGDENKANQIYQGTQPLTANDVAEIVLWIVSTPPHVNINHLEVMPVCQAWGPLAVSRE